jgi:hypothetical protein
MLETMAASRPAQIPWISHEPLLASGLAIAVLLLLAPAPQLSPDSHELLAIARSWAGLGPREGPSPWPPLWPLLCLPFVRLAPQVGPWILNLVLAGAVASPLYSVTRRLGGVWPARAAVLCWVLLPAVHHSAPILDARPALWLISAWTMALALRALEPDGAWWPAFAVASLAALARPEGLMLIPLLTLTALLAGARFQALALAAAALGPLVATKLLGGAGRSGYEAFALPWEGVWAKNDILALTGPASAATPFRRFLLEAAAQGLESPSSDLSGFLRFLPTGSQRLLRALAGALGLFGAAGAFVGAGELWRRGWRVRAGLGLILLPLLALAALPMAWIASTPAGNLVFLLPALLALACLGWAQLLPRRHRKLLLLLPALLLLELNLAPWRLTRPTFIGDSTAATTMAHWLEAHPPAGGRVACSYSARQVVRDAGLVPEQLPSSWDHLDPALPVLITQGFLEDAGRSLDLLEDQRRSPLAWAGPQWEQLQEDDDWYLYLGSEYSSSSAPTARARSRAGPGGQAAGSTSSAAP